MWKSTLNRLNQADRGRVSYLQKQRNDHGGDCQEIRLFDRHCLAPSRREAEAGAESRTNLDPSELAGASMKSRAPSAASAVTEHCRSLPVLNIPPEVENQTANLRNIGNASSIDETTFLLLADGFGGDFARFVARQYASQIDERLF